MSTTGTPLHSSPSAIMSHLFPASALPSLRHRRFTVDQYEDLVRTGVLTENDRCELIRGVIIDKMGIGDLHTACVKRLNRFFNASAGDRYLVSIQDPIRLPDSEPEPDCAIVKYRSDFYSSGKPQASDILLLIEVADSSLDLDRGAKLSLYAEARIVDYWIVNVVDDCIEVHRQPAPAGSYADRLVIRRGDRLSPLALPDLALTAEDILGGPSAG